MTRYAVKATATRNRLIEVNDADAIGWRPQRFFIVTNLRGKGEIAEQKARPTWLGQNVEEIRIIPESDEVELDKFNEAIEALTLARFAWMNERAESWGLVTEDNAPKLLDHGHKTRAGAELELTQRNAEKRARSRAARS